MEIIRITSIEQDSVPYSVRSFVEAEPKIIDCTDDISLASCIETDIVDEKVHHYVYRYGKEVKDLFIHGNSSIEVMQLLNALSNSREMWKSKCEPEIISFTLALENLLMDVSEEMKRNKPLAIRVNQTFTDLFKCEADKYRDNLIQKRKEKRLLDAFQEFKRACLDM